MPATTGSSPTTASERRAGGGVAILLALGWAAAVVAANGFVSLLADLEVEAVHGAGPLAEPLGVAVATLAIAARIARATARSVLLPVECALIAAVALILVPAVVAAIMSDPGTGFLVLGRGAVSVFTLADALLAALAGLIALVVVRARAAGAGRLRWPWERDDEP